MVLSHRGFGGFLDHRCVRRAADCGDVGPGEGQEGEEAVHGGRCWGGVGGDQGTSLGGRGRKVFHEVWWVPH